MLKHATKFVPRPDAFRTAAEAGFRFAEFWLDADCLADWQTIARVASGFPLQYALHFPNRADLDDRALDNAVSLYRALGCSALVIHQPMYRRYHARLLDRGPELRLAVENHRLSLGELERWAAENEWLTLDVEHLWKFTLEDAPLDVFLHTLEKTVSRIATKLVHVHLPGYLPGYEEHRPMYSAREMIFPALSILAQYQFEGLIVGEANREFQNPSELRMDVLLVEHWCELQRERQTPDSSS